MVATSAELESVPLSPTFTPFIFRYACPEPPVSLSATAIDAGLTVASPLHVIALWPIVEGNRITLTSNVGKRKRARRSYI